ncbi:MAG: class I SAM-dependent methyltransferase [Bacteroidota bacterium]
MSCAGDSMSLGRFEFLMMNNLFRRWWQKHREFPLFLRMLRRHGVDLSGAVIMDAGCGSGYGTKLILEEFKPAGIIAFDLMPEQIRLAKRRGLGVDFRTGDATRMEVADASCDAVFIFGILHHIPEWRQALAEAARVLKTGGVLLLEEPHYRFDWLELEAGIAEAGLAILERQAWLLGYFRSYLASKKR